MHVLQNVYVSKQTIIITRFTDRIDSAHGQLCTYTCSLIQLTGLHTSLFNALNGELGMRDAAGDEAPQHYDGHLSNDTRYIAQQAHLFRVDMLKSRELAFLRLTNVEWRLVWVFKLGLMLMVAICGLIPSVLCTPLKVGTGKNGHLPNRPAAGPCKRHLEHSSRPFISRQLVFTTVYVKFDVWACIRNLQTGTEMGNFS